MTPLTIGILGMLVLFVFLMLGLPVGISMLLVGFFGYASIINVSGAIGMLKGVLYSTGANYSMSVVPLFVLMGFFAYHSGLSRDLYNFAYKQMGHRPGGVALATIVASGFFAAICGSSTATTATFGAVCLPEMKRYGYDDSLATGSISAGGTLGILIPPSVGFILYGIIASVSIGRLFAAGMIPGIILCICYMLVVVVQVKIKPERAPASGKFPFRERIRAFWGAFPMVLLFLLVIGGMFLGWFTANQSAAIGAMGAFLYMVIKNRANIRVNYKATVEALWETAKTVGMIFLILIGAYCLGYFMSISTIPTSLAKWIGGLPVNRWVILVAILVFYAFLGCLMDAFAMVLLTTPIFLPIVQSLGFDPVWYGVLMVMVMEMGLITPPVGMNLYIMKGCVGDSISMATIIKGAAPHILGLVAAVTVTLLFPQIALWLPSLFYS